MLALAEIRREEARFEASLDPETRQPQAEATSPLADPNRRREGWHYETHVVKNFARQALRLAQQQRAEIAPDEDAGSLDWSVERVEDGPPEP